MRRHIFVLTTTFTDIGSCRFRHGGSEIFLDYLLERTSASYEVTVVILIKQSGKIVSGPRGSLRVAFVPVNLVDLFFETHSPNIIVTQSLVHSQAWDKLNTDVLSLAPHVAFILDRASQSLVDLQPNRLIYPSSWVQEAYAPADGAVLMHPVIPQERIKPSGGSGVGLVGLNAFKGFDTWQACARALPARQFVGQRTAWGEQLKPQTENASAIPYSRQMDETFWPKVATLLMPSEFEGFGMVGHEAMARGVPVIASPGSGLDDCLGDAAVRIPRDDVVAWTRAIENVLDKKTYPLYRARAMAQANKLEQENALNIWFSVLSELT